MRVESRTQAAKMEERVNQMMAMLAQMDARNKEMKEEMGPKKGKNG